MRTSIAKYLFGLTLGVAAVWFVITAFVIFMLGNALYEGDID